MSTIGKPRFWLRLRSHHWSLDSLQSIDFSSVPLDDMELRVEVL